MLALIPYVISVVLLQTVPASTVVVLKYGRGQIGASQRADRERWQALRFLKTGKVLVESVRIEDESPSLSSLGRGSTDPLPSPNGRYITFTHKRNLWLWDSWTRKRRQITTVGADPNRKFQGVLVLTTDWSFDSKEILYYIAEDVAGEEIPFPNSVRRPVEFGFHVYNIESHRSRSIKIPRTMPDDQYPIQALAYEAWLPNGTVIATDDSGIMLVDPTSGETKPFTNGNGFGQITASPTGEFLVATITPLPASVNQNRIMKIDLQTGQVTPISPLGNFAEFQWPTVSPSGHHICYLRIVPQRDDLGRIREGTTVICDDKAVFHTESERISRLQWIDDSTVTIVGRDEVVTSDIMSSTEISRQKIPVR